MASKVEDFTVFAASCCLSSWYFGIDCTVMDWCHHQDLGLKILTWSHNMNVFCVGSNLSCPQQLEQSEQEKLDLQNRLKAEQGGEASAGQRVSLFISQL